MSMSRNDQPYGQLREAIERFVNEYAVAKTEIFAQHPFGSFVRSDIPKILYSTNIVDPDKYLITGSVGQGNWATVPWVCIFDRLITTTAQKGVYIVYLLSKDTSTLYLTFNQGCTELRRTHKKQEVIQIMRECANEIINSIDSHGFQTDEDINLGDGLGELAELYQKGTIFYKAYHKGAIPSEEEVQGDLRKMMDVYREYYRQFIQNEVKTGVFDSWEIIDDTTAIKTCDKSFFEHNGSGIPKGIYWFFDANSLLPGESRSIRFIYDGQEHSGRLTREAAAQQRVRVFWSNELGALFRGKADRQSARTIFKKSNTDEYLISLGGEGVLSTKETVQQIKNYIAYKGFSYEEGLIENFYLSLKSKPFVILAGTSGTGKTRLVKLFAEAIGATNANGRYQMVSVRPDWSDSTDLFGHVDLNGHFLPGTIIDFVKRAQDDADHPYILCLDEMNLARVEYYLSDILSVIETRELTDSGSISSDPLVPANYFGSDQDAIMRYGTLPFPENMYIVGTVNMDETTFPFSKKVLDRANTIEFSYVDLLPDDIPLDTVSPLELSNSFLKSKYLLLKQCQDVDTVNRYCAELKSINEILKLANAHVGYRVRDEIVFYLLNNKEAALVSETVALDYEIMQKILPRIQGSSTSVKNMLCDLFKFCAGDYEGYQTETDDISAKMLRAAQKPECKYKNSANKIAYMVRRYEEDGFTTYWL